MSISNDNIFVTVIIATYNSSSLLPLVLDSVKKQIFKKGKIEVLIVDGGSNDRTIEIAKKYGCSVVNNPKTEPVYAKILGFKKAKGRYHVYLDHDEVIENKNSIYNKFKTLSENEHLFAVAGSGYKNPYKYPFINQYINDFGDPFSCFMYRLSKDSRFFVKTMDSRYKNFKSTNHYNIYDLSNVSDLPLMELVAGGTMIDSSFFKKEYPNLTSEIYFLGQAFHLMCIKNPFVAVTKNDNLIHYSSETVKKYFGKIKWRVRNNIFELDSRGKAAFLGREIYYSNLFKIKKYTYPLYVFLIVPLLIDTFSLIVSRKDFHYLVHFPLSFYTAIIIVYYYLLKYIGINPDGRNYDGSMTK